MRKIDFFKHTLGAEEKEALVRSLDQPFLTTGPIVADFEKQFSEFVGAEYTVGMMSCTAALHLALLACDVGLGDEVITTPMTFVATSLAINHCGATPTWVDVEPDTGNIDVAKIEAAITPRTKVILPVHLYGQMCDMRGIREIADRHGLRIIEDAAHSLIACRDNVRVGQLADICCYSFYATKSITCGEGGAATTNNKSMFGYMQRNRSHGLSSDAASRYLGKFTHWTVEDFGWKYNMDNIKASLLIPQIAKAKSQRLIRKHCCERYATNLSGCPGISMPKIIRGADSDYHLFTIWSEKRDALIEHLQDRGIGVTVNYRSINLLKAVLEKYGKGRGSFPNSEKIGDQTLSLPLHCLLTDDEIDYVCSAVREFQ